MSIDRLKPHRGAAPVQPALPPCQRPASRWLISSYHPLPQGLVLARGPVAAQMYISQLYTVAYYFARSLQYPHFPFYKMLFIEKTQVVLFHGYFCNFFL